MSENTLSEIRKEGEKLLSTLERFFYSNFTGLRSKPGIEDIFRSHGEFTDPGLFLSVSTSLSTDETQDTGLCLLRKFLADMYVLSRTSKVTDKIVTLETKLRLKADDQKIPLRSAGIKIQSQTKKKIRGEIQTSLEKARQELAPLYLERHFLALETFEELGITGLPGVILSSERPDDSRLTDQARSFLKDTDYVSREMLEWFLVRETEIPPKDATFGDITYLLNSFELKAAFPADEYEIPALRVLDDSGLVNSADVKAESGVRAGKLPGSFLFLTSPPAEMAVSVYPTGGLSDYESYLSALGSALSFVFTNIDDDFEFRYLRDPGYKELFSELFKNLVYERSWLQRYIDWEFGDDFYKLIFFRRLMRVREQAANFLYEDSLYSGESEEGLRDIYKELMENALHTEVSEWGYLTPHDIREYGHSAFLFKSLLIEPRLSKYLTERFDEEWWRVKDAGTELKRVWSEGGRITTDDMGELSGFNGTSDELRSIFERELG